MFRPLATNSKPLHYDGQRLINCFVRPAEGVSQGVLIGASGTITHCDLGAPIRAMITQNGVLYAVAGGHLWRIDGNAGTQVGAISDGPTWMATNGRQIAIVSQERYYIYDGVTTAEFTAGAVAEPYAVTYMDGYFIVVGFGQDRFDLIATSKLDDGKVFDGSAFAAAENSSDMIVDIVADHNQVWIFGENTTEVWSNVGTSGFPLAPNKGAAVQDGAISKTVAQVDNSLFWIAPDGRVLRASGGSPAVVSTREIEDDLDASTVEAAFSFTDKNHPFYAIRRAGKSTLCYDVTTQLWSERASGEINQGQWSACCSCFLGEQLIGTSTGKIGRLSPDHFQDDGQPLTLEVTTKPIVHGGQRFSVSQLSLLVESGGVDIGRNAEIALRTSGDGKLWSTEVRRQIGRGGEYQTVVDWHNLGQYQRFQVNLRITDPIPRDIWGVSYV